MTDQIGVSQYQPWQGTVSDGSLWALGNSNTFASANNPGGSFQHCTMNAWGEADLSEGTLKAVGNVASTATAVRRCDGRGIAGFGDTFTTLTPGGPFVWQPGNAGTFTMQLTGSANGTSAFPPILPLRLWTVGVWIFPVGGRPQSANLAAQWTGVPGSIEQYLGVNGVAMNAVGTLETGGIQLSMQFAPGGDFSWYMQIEAGGMLYAYPGHIAADLSHTLTASYRGPQGTYVQSASGVFPGTVVPEPGTFVLVMGGLLFVGAFVRGRASSQNRVEAVPLKEFV